MFRAFKKDVSRASMKGHGPMSFENILADPVNLKYFKQFCIQEMSVENLLFWLEVEDYRTIDAPEYRAFVAKKVYRKYIQPDAPMGIAVNDRTRKEIKLTKNPESTMYNKLQEEVLLSMKMDIFSRFVDDELYAQLLALKFEERKVVDIDDFDIYRFLGAGGFGMVLLAKKRDTGRFYAIKVLDKRILISQNQCHSIFREKEVLAVVEHPFVVALRYAFQTPDHLCFVLDYIEGGNMYSDLMRGPYTHERAVFYAAQIVLATQHLHELDILYRDLKPDNVLLTLDGSVKLADMGAARGIGADGTIEAAEGSTSTASKTAKAPSASSSDKDGKEGAGKGRRMTITGTHGYRAPEVYERDYGKAADWWNVGILIIEMLTAENPLRGENRRESEYMTKHKVLELPAYLHDDARDVALRFLDRDPTQRLGCGERGVDEIKEHPFFGAIDWDKLMAEEMEAPFESDLDYEPPARQPVPKESATQLDYFCQMVDYMKTSMSMRTTWPLKPEDQKVFEDFDYVSNKVFEDELNNAFTRQNSGGFGLGGLGQALPKSGPQGL